MPRLNEDIDELDQGEIARFERLTSDQQNLPSFTDAMRLTQMRDGDIRKICNRYAEGSSAERQQMARAIIRRKHEIAAGYGLDAPYYHLTRDELAALGGGDAEAGANVVDQTFAGVPIKDGRERIIPGRILT